MKKLTTILLIGCLAILSVSAAPYYDTGSQIFTITAGPTVPLTNTSFEGENDTTIGPGATGFKAVGGYGSITYQVFTNPYVALGGELGYQFNFDNGNKIFTSVPMLFKTTFFPVQGTFELPIGLGIGMNYISYAGMSLMSFGVTADIGFRWYFSNEWGLGVHTGLSIIPELYVTDDKIAQNALTTFVPVTLSVSYRH